MPELIIALVIVVLVVVALGSSVKIIHQQKIGLVERLGKFHRRLTPGPHLVVPVIDRVQYNLDMREQVQPFPPQGVITEDNLMVNIDSVIYFQIVDPERAAYEAQSYRTAIEQLTMTTLRNIIGGMDMEAALTSREEINQKLRSVLDEATGKWGIKVNRVELRAIEPPPTIRDAMEKGARAERDKRAAILLAEGQRQSQILAAGGDRESAILRAQGDREAQVLRAQADRQAQMLRSEGEAQAITTVFNAIHAGQPDQGLLAYQYMQMLPTLARGDANKVWIVPSELNDALRGLGQMVGEENRKPTYQATDPSKFDAPKKVDVMAEIAQQKEDEKAQSDATVQQAIEEAAKLENPGLAGKPRQGSLPSSRPEAPSPAQRGGGHLPADQQAQGPMGGAYQTGWGSPTPPPEEQATTQRPQPPRPDDQPFNPRRGDEG